MTIFFMANRAWATRPATSGSGLDSNSLSRFGTTCQDSPNLSLSQPHGPSSPPSVRAVQ